MSLTKLGNGSFKISSQKEAREAAQLIEERNEAIAEIEAEMEEQYDLQTMRREAVELHRALTKFMDDKSVDKLEMGEYRWQVVRGFTRTWDAGKLKAKLGKAKFLQVCKLTPDPELIDDLVRQGKIKLDDIESALDETPKAPYIKRYENREAKGDAEADKLKEAMGG